jgi:hypothetical protein
VRFRPARTLALIAGVLVAAAFTVLTAASRTAQVRTVGKVSANFQPAYDILVRPEGARTAMESKTGTVQAGSRPYLERRDVRVCGVAGVATSRAPACGRPRTPRRSA